LSFRECFARIGEVRSVLDKNIHIMSLTATATTKLREEVSLSMGLIAPSVIVQSPDKENTRVAVMKIGNYDIFSLSI
jgi:superfamily II DNA helicase RecQ